MESSNFSQNQNIIDIAEPLNVGGATSECFKVKLYGKMHFLKQLKPELRNDPRYVAAMRKEFETGYNLDHPHLVRYLACGDDYLLTEFIDGTTLSEFAKDNPAFFNSKANVDRLLNSLIDVLDYLHSHQIVHLDLKPDNILITHVGNELKLTDLGFCYTDTYTDTMGRTDSFAAPEQFDDNGTVDHRTDIYAVGRIISSLPCSARYRKVIERCTKPNKEDRYQSATQIKNDLNKQRSKWLAVAVIAVIAGLMALVAAWWLSPKSTNETATQVSATANTSAAHSDIEDETSQTSQPSQPSQPEKPIIINNDQEKPALATTSIKPATIDQQTLRKELMVATQPIYNKYLKQYENVTNIEPFDKNMGDAIYKFYGEIADKLFRLYETKYKPMGVLESDYNPIASNLMNSYTEKIERVYYGWGKSH